jgi:hypothetical protein
MSEYYTGIGSRNTPIDVLETMVKIAAYLERLGYTLRSGGAAGADSAFEQGAVTRDMEIYLPWIGFNNRPSDPPYYPMEKMSLKLMNIAAEITEKYHPAWQYLSVPAAKLHIRNAFQVLGQDLKTPSKFIVCWTGPAGGTTQALRIAEAQKIPVFNLTNPNAIDDLKSFLRKTAV